MNRNAATKLMRIYTTSKSGKNEKAKAWQGPTWHKDCIVVNWYNTSLNWTYRHHACNVCQELAHRSIWKPYGGCKNKWITGTYCELQHGFSCAELHVDTWTLFSLVMPTNISIRIMTLRREFASSVKKRCDSQTSRWIKILRRRCFFCNWQLLTNTSVVARANCSVFASSRSAARISRAKSPAHQKSSPQMDTVVTSTKNRTTSKVNDEE